MLRKYLLPLAVLALLISAQPASTLAGSTPTNCYPPLSLVTNSIPSATAGSNYTAILTANGGQPPYSWSFGQSSLPSGFAISTDGALSGTPMTAGTYTFNVVVSDSLKNNVTGALTLIVAAAPTGTTGTGTTGTGTTGTGTTTPPPMPPPTITPPPTPTPPTSPAPPPVTGTGPAGGGGQVATPTLSVGSGAVAPGTSVTASDSTSGATIYYTLTTDGSTPPDPTYDSATYMPGLGTTSAILGTAGTSGITAGNTFVAGILVYGSVNVKFLAAKSGMTDSSIVSASYTLTGPTGTAISACGKISGTNYLTTDVSASGTCFVINGNNTTLNLNGHTLTYGTANGVVLQGTGSVTSGSPVVSCPNCTAAMVGDFMEVDNYNTSGGSSNNWSGALISPTILAVVAGTATLSRALPFTASPAEYTVYAPPAYGVLCDPSIAGSCGSLAVYNGTITQGANAAANSNAVEINPHGYGAGGAMTFANLTANISGPEAEFVYMSTVSGGNVIANNVVNDSVTQIFYRDGLPYPIKLNGPSTAATSPINYVHDNKIYGSPQGDVYAKYTSDVMNNYYDHNGSVQYANGFCSFAAVDGDVFMGNSCNGYMQGNEEEASNDSFVNNYTAITMQDPVHDPNHNIPQCELGYGFREKDFNGSGTPLTGGSGSQFNNVLSNNVFNDIDGNCGANDIEFSLVYRNDTTSVTGNILTLTMNTSAPTNTSEIYGADGSDLTGVTYSGNTNSITGAYARQGVMAYFNYDQVQNWTLPGITAPTFVWRQGASGINSTATFSGTGTATCAKIPNAGSSSTIAFTYNGTSVTCQ